MASSHLPWFLFSITWISWWKLSPCSSLTSVKFGLKNLSENANSAFLLTSCIQSCSMIAVRLPQDLHNYRLYFFQQNPCTTSRNDCQASLSKLFILSSNSLEPRICWIWGPVNIPPFIFDSDRFGNIACTCMIASLSDFNAFMNCFARPNFVWSVGNKIFSLWTRGWRIT